MSAAEQAMSVPAGSARPPYHPAIPPDARPDYDRIVVEDGKPVDSIYADRQLRLLTEPLSASWKGPPDGRPYMVFADVGLFFSARKPPLVPDVMLSLGIEIAGDPHDRPNRSYFMWEMEKPPDVVIEIVSAEPGGEDTDKLRGYARVGVPHYVIYDPLGTLGPTRLRVFSLHEGLYRPSAPRFADIGLGLTEWEGEYEGLRVRWLRWNDAAGRLIPTGLEQSQRADAESRRADAERQRAAEESRRAQEQERRAAEEARRADAERQRAERLAAKLKELGVDTEA